MAFMFQKEGSLVWEHVTSRTIPPDANGWTVFPGTPALSNTVFDRVYKARYFRIHPVQMNPSTQCTVEHAMLYLDGYGCDACPDTPDTCCDWNISPNQNAQCIHGGNVSFPNNWTACDNCSCIPRYHGVDPSECELCPANSWCSGGSHVETCPADSSSPMGSETITACQCNGGFFGPAGGPCGTCPLNSSSVAQSTQIQDCVCNDGLYLDVQNAECDICAIGSYCSLNDVTGCPQNATSLAGSSSFADCQCVDHFYMKDSESNCTECPPNWYCPLGNEVVFKCPTGSMLTMNSALEMTCICPTGYVFEPPDACVICPMDPNQLCVDNIVTPSGTYNSNQTSPNTTSCVNEGHAENNLLAYPTVQFPEVGLVSQDINHVIPKDSWLELDVAGGALMNAIEFSLYPGHYTREYMEICSVDHECHVIHDCTSCSAWLVKDKMILPFREMLVHKIRMFFGARDNTIWEYVLMQQLSGFYFMEACVCSKHTELCPTDCSSEHLNRFSFSECRCDDGYEDRYPDAPGNLMRCFPCPRGPYCQGGQRIECPTSMSTRERYAASAQSCICMDGKYRDSGVCKDCPVGYYCQNENATKCPNGFITLAQGAESSDHCVGMNIQVVVSEIGRFSELLVSWVPTLDHNHSYVIVNESTTDQKMEGSVYELFVPISDGTIEVDVSLTANKDKYRYCPGSTPCVPYDPPSQGGCPDGLYVNVRQNEWQKVREMNMGPTTIPMCGVTSCTSTYYTEHELLVYPQDGAATLTASQVYLDGTGLHVVGAHTTGSLTMRWGMPQPQHVWPTWEYNVKSRGSISCSTGDVYVELKWGTSVDDSSATVISKQWVSWDIDVSTLLSEDKFLFAVIHLVDTCEVNIEIPTIEVWRREENTPCLSLWEHQNVLTTGSIEHIPRVSEAYADLDGVFVSVLGNPPTECRKCPQGYYCSGAGNIQHCGYESNTITTAAANPDECLCSAGHSPEGDSCAQCPSNSFKETNTNNDTCTQCQPHEITVRNAVTLESECLCVEGYTNLGGVGCVQCDANTYKDEVGNVPCAVCGDHMISPPGSTSPGNCTCDVGYAPNGQRGCLICAPGTYKDNSANEECTQCPPDTFNPHSGAVNVSACSKCPIGTIGSENALTNLEQCVECPTDAYAHMVGGQRVCVACPENSTSPPQSSTIDACLCKPGHYLDTGKGACVQCKPGSIKEGIGNENCTLCPPGTFEPRRGVSNTPNCFKCRAGTYQPFEGASLITQCLKCPAATYSPNVSATNDSTCQACPMDSTSLEGSSDKALCRCNPGFFLDGNTCVQCAIGTYKDHYGDDACDLCPFRSSTESLGSISLLECLCDSGYFITDLGCAPCPIGTYKGGVSNSFGCNACPDHQTTLQIMSSHIGQCVCDKGSVETDINVSTSERTCISCEEDSYQPAVNSIGLTSCLQCFTFAYTAPFSTNVGDCKCNDTFVQHAWGECMCPDGHYLDTHAERCVACPHATYQPHNNTETACMQCTDYSNTVSEGSTSVRECICDENFRQTSNGTCVCVAGRQFNNMSHECIECTVSTYKNEDMDTCEQCPQDMRTLAIASDDISDCICNPTFVYNASDGCLCEAGKYLALFPRRCVECENSTFTDHAQKQTSCNPCQLNSVTMSTGSSSVDDCICIPAHGYHPETKDCHACQAGFYKGDFANSVCLPCASGSWSLPGSTECYCVPGFRSNPEKDSPVNLTSQQGAFAASYTPAYIEILSGACVLCEPDHYKESYGDLQCTPCRTHSQTLDGRLAVSPEACMCSAGYYENDLNLCEICKINTYKSAVGNMKVCHVCHNHSITLSEGSTSISDCVCVPGHEPAYNLTIRCSECNLGYYKNTSNNTACAACPSHSTTMTTGSTSLLDACICEPGWIMNTQSLQCEQCPPSTFKSGYHGECMQCPEGTESYSGSTSPQDCLCAAGEEPSSEGSECVACKAGFYKPDISNDACTRCALNTAPTPDHTSCVPMPGFFYEKEDVEDVGSFTIRLCPLDTYKDQTADVECTACPEGFASDIGSTSLDQCLCKAGTEQEQAVCVPCEEGYYCKGDDTKIMCPALTSSIIGSDDITDCECTYGYYMAADSCVQCPPNTFKPTIGNIGCLQCNANNIRDWGGYALDTAISTCGETGRTQAGECRPTIVCQTPTDSSNSAPVAKTAIAWLCTYPLLVCLFSNI
eukprot:2271480-Rhodomonas_salina.1